jgi:hypothetical protein
VADVEVHGVLRADVGDHVEGDYRCVGRLLVGSIIVIVSDIKEEQPLAVVSQDILLIAVVAEPLSAALGQLSLVRQGTIDQTVSHTIRNLLQQYTFCNLLISTTISDDGKIAIWV